MATAVQVSALLPPLAYPELMQKVGVVGLGYVGLPLVVAFAQAGSEVVGFDINEGLISSLRSGSSHIEDVPASQLADVAETVTYTSDAVR